MCNHNKEAPKFHVYLAMIGVRFRFDRVEGMAVNSPLLLQVRLADHTAPSVAQLVYRIEHILAELEADEVPPTYLMYQIMKQDFMHAPQFAYKFRKIRDSTEDSKYRTWYWLFGRDKKRLASYSGDKNFE